MSATCATDVYEPKVIGMMWSSLAQLQTWFGAEPWKSYGIQVPCLPAISSHYCCVESACRRC